MSAIDLGRSALAVALAAALVTCAEPGIHAPEVTEEGARAIDIGAASTAGTPSGPPEHARGSGARAGEGPDFADLPLEPLGSFEPPHRPEPELARAIVGPEGGSLRLGDFEIEVPEGAVTRNTLFMIRRPVDRRSRTRVVAELRPHRVTFERPVIVRMPLEGTSVAGVPEATIVRFGDEGWAGVPTRIIDDGARLETRTRHLSFWGTAFLLGELSSGG